MTGTRKWNSGTVAGGRIYIAIDNQVYAFGIPGGTPTPIPTATATPTPRSTVTPIPTPAPTPTPGQITLTARGYKVRGGDTVDLTWTGPTCANVDIYRNGRSIDTIPNIPGFYIDSTGQKGNATSFIRCAKPALKTVRKRSQ